MKITDYPKVTELTNQNVFLLDGPNGTKGILSKPLITALLSQLTTKEIMENISLGDLDRIWKNNIQIFDLDLEDQLLVGTASGNKYMDPDSLFWAMMDLNDNYMLRRTIYRGKNLGSVVTDEQWAEIAAGTFKGMFLGDYWEIGGRVWRIMDFNYWWNTGDTPCRVCHLVIMPDTSLYISKFNLTVTSQGGYIGSYMYQTGLNEAKTIINGAFGSNHILNHRESLSNAISLSPNGRYLVSGCIWADSTVEIPNEIMVWGSRLVESDNTNKTIDSLTIDYKQLAGFSIKPSLAIPWINSVGREHFWLRDIVDDGYHVVFAYFGAPIDVNSTSDIGVRPVFGIKG